MKRHPALVPLSQDHHQALVSALKLRRATAETAADAARAFREHWETGERLHFRIEEEVLLPAFAAYADPDHPVVVQVLLEHVAIRRDADRLTSEAPVELLHDLGARLSAHVELEERRLFPLIEETLPEDALVALGERLRAAEAAAQSRDGSATDA